MTGHIETADHVVAYTGDVTARPRARRRATVLLGTVAVLLLGAGGAWVAMQHSASSQTVVAAPPPPAVTVSAPLQRDVTRWADFTGQFSAVDQVELRAQVAGYLTEIHFADGQVVKKGDLLFVIDQRPYQIALQQATAQYQAAVAALDLANKQVSRASELHRNDFTSGEVLDQRVQAQLGAQAQIEQAKAQIHSAQLNLDFTRITAPFSGRVSMRRVSIGSLISSGTPLTSIVSLDPIYLDFDMSEADYLVYRRFQAANQAGTDPKVEASLSDEPGWKRQGSLDFIDNQMDRSSGTMHARASFANADLLIAPGQFGRLRLPVSKPAPALLVPDLALVTDQSRKLVMVVAADGTVTPKPVEIGALEGSRMRVITKGLTSSDQVIINGLMRARPGSKVTPQPGQIAVASQD
jgi:RND family efflux transporter MFP subunit